MSPVTSKQRCYGDYISSSGSRGAPPPPLFWVKKKKWLKGKWPAGQVNQNSPPPPPPLAHGLDPPLISTVSRLLIPLNFAYITSGILGFLWIVFILYSVLVLRRIKEEQRDLEKKWMSKRFRWRFLFHVCIQLAVVGLMMGRFCGFQTLHLPTTIHNTIAFARNWLGFVYIFCTPKWRRSNGCQDFCHVRKTLGDPCWVRLLCKSVLKQFLRWLKCH